MSVASAVLSLLGLLTVVPTAAALPQAGQTAPASSSASDQDAAEPAAPQDEEEVVQVLSLSDGQVKLKPASALDETGSAIADIDAHRVSRLPYVRRAADIVECDLGPINVDAEVLMTIGDTPVLRDEFRKRAIMYMGTNEIDRAITRTLCEVEIERLIEQGQDPDAFLVSEAEIDQKIEDMFNMLRLRATGGQQPDPDQPDPGEQAVADFLRSVEASIGMDAYRQRQRAEASFEKVFLPMPTEPTGEEVWNPANGPVPPDDPKPAWMPQLTWDSLDTDDTGRSLRQYIKRAAAEGQPIAPMFRGQLTSRIRLGILDILGMDYFFDTELPPNVFARVASRDITTDELWPFVEPTLSDADRDLILREMLTLKAMRNVLEKAGQWLSDEEFAEAFQAEEDLYKGTLLPLRSIIVFRGYYSLDRYREHFRYAEAYRRWRTQTLTDEELDEHYREGGRLFFERGTVFINPVYLHIGEEAPFGNARFEEMVAELEQALEASDGDFEAVMALYPPPQRPTSEGAAEATERNRHFQRNPLRQYFTESELSTLVTGYSLADDIFYNAVPGEVFPIRAQKCRRHYWGQELNAGAWLVQAGEFQTARPLAPLEARELDQARQDYLDLNFAYWAQECLKDLLGRLTDVNRH